VEIVGVATASPVSLPLAHTMLASFKKVSIVLDVPPGVAAGALGDELAVAVGAVLEPPHAASSSATDAAPPVRLVRPIARTLPPRFMQPAGYS
jgi:hypothetical protein